MSETAVGSRTSAHDILIAVLEEKRPLDEAFDPATKALGPRDRAFVRMLVATTLRHMGRIDLILKDYLETPVPKRAIGARHLMRLGAAQLLFLGTPAHAAVATAVEAARRRQLAPYAGLINAVLRKVSKEGAPRLKALSDPLADFPDWLAQSWQTAYGSKTAIAIARASAREARLDLTPRDMTASALSDLVGGTVLTLTGSVRMPPGSVDVTTLPGFREGAWWVQDAAAALPVRLMGDVAGLRVLDLCAAPGGKTLQLAAGGAIVTAIDRSADRLKRLRENLARTGLESSVRIVCDDAAKWRPAKDADPFDLVLLDAPCTATGTIRRHPDIPWLKRPGDAEGLATAQDALIDAALKVLKPGGTLIYSVCSLQPEEGTPRIDAALHRHPGLARRAFTPAETGLEDTMITSDGDVRIFPFHLGELGGMDGFFVARLIKAE